MFLGGPRGVSAAFAEGHPGLGSNYHARKDLPRLDRVRASSRRQKRPPRTGERIYCSHMKPTLTW
jgi:hypothetical protein